MSGYDFPLTTEGDESPFEGVQLASGVKGYAIEKEDALYIPVIMADSPGSGDVGRFLDSLPRHKAIKFPTVISLTLAGMLKRRGYFLVSEEDPEFGPVAVFTLPALATSPTPPVEHGSTQETP